MYIPLFTIYICMYYSIKHYMMIYIHHYLNYIYTLVYVYLYEHYILCNVYIYIYSWIPIPFLWPNCMVDFSLQTWPRSFEKTRGLLYLSFKNTLHLG